MKTNVLVFPAGEINSVELHDALSHNVNIQVFGASSIDRHGPYIYKHYRNGLPFISDDSFIDKFNQLIEEWSIDYVIPTHDTVALFFAKNNDLIKANIITADYRTSLICRNKKLTYALFHEESFCPIIYNEIDHFPCFVKPIEGQGAVGASIVNSLEEIPVGFDTEDYVICEYLNGDELTVDCITDKDGKLRAVLPRIRKRLMAGVCVSGETVQATEEIMKIAETINKKLAFLGLWYFQVKKDSSGYYKLLEISTRCAGTMCLSRARGINLPLLSVYSAMGKEISVFQQPFNVKMDRTLISRYSIDYKYSTVYIDYDDTIIEKDEVSLPLVRFLYQCRNQGKKIVLISRHESDHEDTIFESLRAHAISELLFDKIIKLTFDEEKSDYINKKDAIFIDNSFMERKKVHDILSIPVFDVEGIEVITDWRS